MLSWIRRNKVVTGAVGVGVAAYLFYSYNRVEESHAGAAEDGPAEILSAIDEKAFVAAAAAIKANPAMNLSDQQVDCLLHMLHADQLIF